MHYGHWWHPAVEYGATGRTCSDSASVGASFGLPVGSKSRLTQPSIRDVPGNCIP